MADWLTLVPALVAIVIVLWRKEVILALLLSLCSAELLIFLQAGQGAGPGLLLDGAQAGLRRFERALAAGHGDKDMAASHLASHPASHA